MFAHNGPYSTWLIWRILSDSPENSTGAKCGIYDCLVDAVWYMGLGSYDFNCAEVIIILFYVSGVTKYIPDLGLCIKLQK